MAVEQIQIRTGLQRLDCTIPVFTALCSQPMVKQKFSQQQMNQIVSGRVDADPEDVKQLLSVIRTMDYLQDTIKPNLPINWGSNPLLVRDVLVKTYEERLNAEDPIIRQACYIRTSALNYFVKLRGDGSPVETINAHEAAAFLDFQLAREGVKLLKAKGVSAFTDLLTGLRRESTITKSLEELGFKLETEVSL